MSLETPDRALVDRRLRRLFALVGTVFSGFLPFFVLWLRDRGFSPSQIGIVLAITSLAALVAGPVWGHVADTRWGSLPTLRTAFAAASVAALALAVTGSVLLVVAGVAAVLMATTAPQTPLSDALTMTTLGSARLHEYGTFRLWASVGWGVGAIAFGALFQVAGLGVMLPLYAAGLAGSALYLRGFPRGGPAVQAAESRWGSLGDALLHVPRLPLYLAGVFLVGASTHAAWDFVPLRIAAGGGGPLLVGLGAGLSAFVEIPFMRSSGSLMDRVGPRIVFVSGAGVYIAASLAWAVLDAPLAVTLVRIAIGVGFGLTYVALVVMTGRLVPQRLRNTGQSLLQMCMQGLAPVVGGLVGGIVYQHLGPTQLFVGSAVGIVVGISVVWIATTRLPDAVTADPAG